MIDVDLEAHFISEYQKLEDSGVFSDSTGPSDQLLAVQDIKKIISDVKELMDVRGLYSDPITYYWRLKSRMDEIRTLITHEVYTEDEANRLKRTIVEIYSIIRLMPAYINKLESVDDIETRV